MLELLSSDDFIMETLPSNARALMKMSNLGGMIPEFLRGGTSRLLPTAIDANRAYLESRVQRAFAQREQDAQPVR